MPEIPVVELILAVWGVGALCLCLSQLGLIPTDIHQLVFRYTWWYPARLLLTLAALFGVAIVAILHYLASIGELLSKIK